MTGKALCVVVAFILAVWTVSAVNVRKEDEVAADRVVIAELGKKPTGLEYVVKKASMGFVSKVKEWAVRAAPSLESVVARPTHHAFCDAYPSVGNDCVMCSRGSGKLTGTTSAGISGWATHTFKWECKECTSGGITCRNHNYDMDATYDGKSIPLGVTCTVTATLGDEHAQFDCTNWNWSKRTVTLQYVTCCKD